MACNDFPPFKIEHPTDNNPGSDVEILHEIFKLSKTELQTPFMPWKRALLEAQTGSVTGLCSCSKTKEREKNFYFSNKMGSNSVGIFLSEPSVNISKLADLKDLTVGVVRGYNLENELIEKNITTHTTSRTIELIKMLDAKRIDALYGYRTTIKVHLKELKLEDKFNYIEIKNAPYFACFSKQVSNSKELLKSFNNGLEIIKKNGVYKNILKKYHLLPYL